MVKTVKLNKKENYLIDKITDKLIDKYDPDNANLKLIIKLENSMLEVDASAIKIEYGGQIVAQYNDDKFIIDDGHQDTLIKAGYIVYKNYDESKELDREAGISMRESIVEEIRDHIDQYTQAARAKNDTIDYHYDKLDSTISYTSGNYQYTYCIQTIDSMVNKNKQRKDNSLPYYPFTKDMDKYGTLYVAVFAKKVGKYVKDHNEKYKASGNLITDFIYNLGSNYHYVSLPVRKRVLNWRGI